jgi:hypothetical protein
MAIFSVITNNKGCRYCFIHKIDQVLHHYLVWPRIFENTLIHTKKSRIISSFHPPLTFPRETIFLNFLRSQEMDSKDPIPPA